MTKNKAKNYKLNWALKEVSKTELNSKYSKLNDNRTEWLKLTSLNDKRGTYILAGQINLREEGWTKHNNYKTLDRQFDTNSTLTISILTQYLLSKLVKFTAIYTKIPFSEAFLWRLVQSRIQVEAFQALSMQYCSKVLSLLSNTLVGAVDQSTVSTQKSRCRRRKQAKPNVTVLW